MREFAEVKRRQGERRETGTRKISVRKFICVRVLVGAPKLTLLELTAPPRCPARLEQKSVKKIS